MAGTYIPKPFRRPSISLDKPVKKWQKVYPDDISIGDLIPDFGAVAQGGRSDDGWTVWFTNITGEKRLVFHMTDRVFAFTAGR